MATIHLHMGTAKTGTTSLQRFCAVNREVLEEEGFAYPKMPFRFEGKGQKHKNASFLSLWNKQEDGRWGEGFATVGKALQEHENAILSDEHVWIMQPEEGFWEAILAETQKLGADLKTIVYLRPQDQMAESHWNQRVKGQAKLTQTFAEFIDGGYGFFPLDYGKILDYAAEHIGKENLTVRVFEKGQFKDGSLFADFLGTLGLGLTDGYRLPGHVSNVRLPDGVAEIKRLANAADSYRRPETPNFYWNAIRQAYGLGTMKEIPEREEGMFSPEERKAYMERFAEGNAHVAREYLGRADGRLFFDGISALPKWEPDGRKMLEDLVCVMAGADTYLYEKCGRQETRMRELEEQLEETERRMRRLEEQLEAVRSSLPLRIYRRLTGGKTKGRTM